MSHHILIFLEEKPGKWRGGGDAVVQLAEALRYKPVGHGFDF